MAFEKHPKQSMPGPLLEKAVEFDTLLSPVGVDDFFATYWELQHLVLRRGQPAYYQTL